MRIISQDGTSDVPYERYSVCSLKDEYRNVYYIVCDYSEKTYRRLAEYSTEEKALKAMEMLREVYASMPITIYPSKVVSTGNAIFQFPQDDEIEV